MEDDGRRIAGQRAETWADREKNTARTAPPGRGRAWASAFLGTEAGFRVGKNPRRRNGPSCRRPEVHQQRRAGGLAVWSSVRTADFRAAPAPKRGARRRNPSERGHERQPGKTLPVSTFSR